MSKQNKFILIDRYLYIGDKYFKGCKLVFKNN